MQEPGPGAVESLCPWAPPHVIITNEAGHTVRGKLMTFCEYLRTQWTNKNDLKIGYTTHSLIK